MTEDLSIYPGGDLVAQGLLDLKDGLLSEEALLVLIASPRLRALGFQIDLSATKDQSYEHALYDRIETRLPCGAHAAYNALIQRVVSFANAYYVIHRKPGSV